jgi:hypothetical protein
VRGSSRTCIALALTALTLLATACSGGSKAGPATQGAIATSTTTAPHPTATADLRPQPSGVPSGAQQERADRDIGAASVPAGADPNTVPMFKSTSCNDGVLTVATTTVNVYAELPCDRALPNDKAQPFGGKPVHIRMVITDQSKLFVDSASAGSVEFTVGRIWTAAP